MHGYFGRLNYDFNEKYLLSINARYDGASSLGSGNKWGFFPGISAGWNISDENFWSVIPEKLLRMKIRASYGINGNISGLGYTYNAYGLPTNNGFYTSQGSYTVGSKYAGVAAVQNNQLANSSLQWERSKTLDFGLDLGVFDNRVTILFDWFRRVTDNLLTSFVLPHSTGFSSILTNLASLENRGVEIELTAKYPSPSSSAFQWDVSFNASTVSNKILKLPFNGVPNNRIGGFYVWDDKLGDYAWKGGLQEGSAMGDYYAYKHLRVFATTEEALSVGYIDESVPQTNKAKRGGDVDFLDADKDGKITTKDMVYVGNQYPKANGGFATTFGWKGVSLNGRFDYMLGQTIYNYTYGTLLGQFQGDNGLSKDLLRSWQKEGDVTDIPRFYWADQQASNNLYRDGNYTSFLYEKGDYLCLRELTLSYSLPKSIIQRAKLASVRINATGNNLHYFTNFRGVNPEDGGRNTGKYPIPRNFIFGVSVTL
jgi:TonB-linked SusC/RagA family outer membrane protein